MEPLALRASDPRELVQAQLPTGKSNRDAALEFEGLIMSQLFQAMRRTVEPSGLFGGNPQTRSTYEYLLDRAVIDRSVQSGRSWGLAQRLEEAWNPPAMKTDLDLGARAADTTNGAR